ncbi:MAG: hypothetical protein NTY19_18380 [Planctomycetota bacterium]|nr:hypothetical protein [Planctomycetota bacterium]
MTSSTFDPTAADNTATDTTTVTTSADLAVSKTGPPTVLDGNNLSYTILVTNLGPSDAQNALLSDAVPANTTFVSATFPADWTQTDAVSVGSAGTLTFTNPLVAKGASGSFTVVVHVNVGLPINTLVTNMATVAATTNDSQLANNTATVTTTVNPQADLQITKTGSPNPVLAGQALTYTITVTNAGPSAVIGAHVADIFPAGLSGVTWSATAYTPGATSAPGSGVGNLSDTANMPTGGTITYVVHATVNAGLTGSLANTAIGPWVVPAAASLATT